MLKFLAITETTRNYRRKNGAIIAGKLSKISGVKLLFAILPYKSKGVELSDS